MVVQAAMADVTARAAGAPAPTMPIGKDAAAAAVAASGGGGGGGKKTIEEP